MSAMKAFIVDRVKGFFSLFGCSADLHNHVAVRSGQFKPSRTEQTDPRTAAGIKRLFCAASVGTALTAASPCYYRVRSHRIQQLMQLQNQTNELDRVSMF